MITLTGQKFSEDASTSKSGESASETIAQEAAGNATSKMEIELLER